MTQANPDPNATTNSPEVDLSILLETSLVSSGSLESIVTSKQSTALEVHFSLPSSHFHRS